MRGAQDAALCAFTIQMPAAEHVWDFSTADVVMKNQPVIVSVLQEKFLATSKAQKPISWPNTFNLFLVVYVSFL